MKKWPHHSKWIVALDVKVEYQPSIIVVIESYNPYKYAVCLRAFIDDKECIIRRWDNIHADDHVDIYYKNRKPKKHQPSDFKIQNNKDISNKLCPYIKKYCLEFIETYQNY